MKPTSLMASLLVGLFDGFRSQRPAVKPDPDIVDRVTDLVRKDRKNQEAFPSRKKRLRAKQRELKSLLPKRKTK